jgi:hypothetical protein
MEGSAMVEWGSEHVPWVLTVRQDWDLRLIFPVGTKNNCIPF